MASRMSTSSDDSTTARALAAAGDHASARDIAALEAAARGVDRKLAPTTILTVLSRLEAKGFVIRDRRSRPHLYAAAATREDHMAELMHEVLGGASDRVAVLERFVGQVSRDEFLQAFYAVQVKDSEEGERQCRSFIWRSSGDEFRRDCRTVFKKPAAE